MATELIRRRRHYSAELVVPDLFIFTPRPVTLNDCWTFGRSTSNALACSAAPGADSGAGANNVAADRELTI